MTMQIMKEKKIQVISRNGQAVRPHAVPKKGFSFWGLFSSSESNSQSHSILLLKDPPVLKKPFVAPKTDTETIRRWVALEERIIHDYKAQRGVLIKPGVHVSRPQVQEKAPIFETLSGPTVTSVPQAYVPALSRERTSFVRMGAGVLSLGWILAGLLAFFYAGETTLRQEVSLQLAETRVANEQLERSWVLLNTTVEEQRKEVQRLGGQVRAMAGELGEARVKTAAFNEMERSYREELVRVTAGYEEQLDGMRQVVKDREALVKILQDHVRSVEKLISKDGLTAALSAALKDSGGVKTIAPAPVSPPQGPVRGEVVMVNRQYRFLIMNRGAEQGLTTGGLFQIFQNGQFLAKGRLERVYPSMAAGTVLGDEGMQSVREGDSVSFS
ncbi:MAG: hypothetical protein KTQ49_01045 [Candidatus Omnitrophica bacterium]|nr:hypothetical protein [Candidatus Omnitrophota bacterium]